MNQFHRDRLFSGIRESHQVPLQPAWAYAVRKQARVVLLPLFRQLILGWESEIFGKRPVLTDMVREIFRGIFSNGSIPVSIYGEVEKVVHDFVDTLSSSDREILGFYALSQEGVFDAMFQEALDRDESEESDLEEDERAVGRIFQNRFRQLAQNDLLGFLMNELAEIENILSNSDLEMDMDTEAITRINEAFSDYLDIPYGEISLIQMPIGEVYFWEKLNAEEPETVGKRVHTERGLEWVECWLLPDGRVRIKGDFLDQTDRDQAAIQSLREELTGIIKAVHQRLIARYGLVDASIDYTFFTRRKCLEHVVPAEGIQFFVDQIETHGSGDFEPSINLDIRRYQNKTLQEWGTKISLGIDDRHWLSEDEMDECKVWVLTMESEETSLETPFSEAQREAIIQSILATIHHCYQLDYEKA